MRVVLTNQKLGNILPMNNNTIYDMLPSETSTKLKIYYNMTNIPNNHTRNQ